MSGVEDTHVIAVFAGAMALLLIITPVFAYTAGSKGPTDPVSTRSYKAHEVIVRVNITPERNGSVIVETQKRMLATLSSVKSGKKAEVIGDMDQRGAPGLRLLRLPEEVEVDDAISLLKNDTSVLYATPNYKKIPEKIPNDPRFRDQWALYNTGQAFNRLSGTPRADIHTTEAWERTTGSKDVIIGILDPSGVEYTLPDLFQNIWTNRGEIPGNGKDDDGNGFIDDIHGWDFYDRSGDGDTKTGEGDNDPSPDYAFDGHGTNCASLIASVGNNGIGTAGTMWSVSVMPLKFDGYTWSEVEAVMYARQMGVPIVCCSFGNEKYGEDGYDYPEAEVMSASPGILFICSAGNDGVNTDKNSHYPSGYPFQNILSVTATDQSDRLPYYSNFGEKTVHLAAPGDNILCLEPDGSYSAGDGTSLAVPFTAGVAGLILSLKPSSTVTEVKNALIGGVDRVPSLQKKMTSEGRLNAASSLAITKPEVTGNSTRTRVPGVYPTHMTTPSMTPTPGKAPVLTRTPQKTPGPAGTPALIRTPAPVQTRFSGNLVWIGRSSQDSAGK